MTSKAILATAALALGGSLLAVSAQAAGVQVGILTCRFEAKENVVVYSEARYSCELKAESAAVSDGTYTGEIRNFGVDLDWSADEVLGWAVLALTDRTGGGSIAGDYVGVGADAAAGLGVGADVLVGSGDKSLALQPVSLTGQTGVGVAAGVRELRLTAK